MVRVVCVCVSMQAAQRELVGECYSAPSRHAPTLQDSLELVFKQSKAVAVTSMSFPLGDVNNFAVGSEDGSVYMACRHGRYTNTSPPPPLSPSSSPLAGQTPPGN